jgi:hypothetical protein
MKKGCIKESQLQGPCTASRSFDGLTRGFLCLPASASIGCHACRIRRITHVEHKAKSVVRRRSKDWGTTRISRIGREVIVHTR